MSTTPKIYSGRYEIVRSIARGGMAEVFLAHDQLLDRPVALKVLFPELSVDKSFVERFRREAQNAANLSNPNIVSVYDWGEEGSTYFIVMEFVDGISVAQQLREEGPYSPGRAAAIANDVASALGFAHRNGVIHRDVKPANILINKSGQVKVTDFGIARARNVEENLTQVGTVMGTATYFSPEQAQGLALDGRSDVYALGVVLYEMLTGEPPFKGENAVTIATKHVNEQPLSVREKNPSISPALEAITMTALAKDVNKRYATAEAMSTDLERFLQGRAVNATVPESSTNATQAMSAVARERYSENMNTAMMQQPTTMGAAVVPATHRRRSDTYLILLMVMLLVLGGILFFLWRGLNGTTGQVTVPSVIGKSQSDAQQMIDNAGLEVKAIVQSDATGDPGLVNAQDPAGGKKVKRGTGVTLTVNKSREQVVVPSLIGKQQAAAETELSALGLTDNIVQQTSDKDVGTVLDQSPAKGLNAYKGDSITLTVSSGQDMVTIPDVTDLTESSAANKLGQAGFTTTSQHQFSPTSAAGRVITTDPAPGTSVKKGSSVTMIISDGPATTTSSSPPSTVPATTSTTH